MKKALFFVGMVFLIIPLFCEAVDSDTLTSKYGISYSERQKYNYIEKDGYSFRYLGEGTWDVKTISQNKAGSPAGKGGGRFAIFIVAVSLIHSILTFCVYKMNGHRFACFYFFLTPLALARLAKDNGNT